MSEHQTPQAYYQIKIQQLSLTPLLTGFITSGILARKQMLHGGKMLFMFVTSAIVVFFASIALIMLFIMTPLTGGA